MMNDKNEVEFIKKVTCFSNMGSLSVEVDGDGDIDFDVTTYVHSGQGDLITHTLSIADLEEIIRQAKHQKEVWQAYVNFNL